MSAVLLGVGTLAAAPASSWAAEAAGATSGSAATTTKVESVTVKRVTKKKTSTKKASAKKATTKKAVAKKGKVRKAKRHGKRARKYVPAVPSAGHLMGLQSERDLLSLKSSVALVLDQQSNEVLFEKNPNAVLPIASLTKLMTALVVVDARQPMDEILEITAQDADYEKKTTSRLRFGTKMTREDAMILALMASENRAASALGRHFPGGLPAFLAAMNGKAKDLGMKDTHFVDPAGLSHRNVSSAVDLARLVDAAYDNVTIREFSTRSDHSVKVGKRRLQFHNTNALVRRPQDWQIGLQKTGFTNEAGRCLVLQAVVQGRNVVMVFLDSAGKLSRFADANRVRKWIESTAFTERPVTTPVATTPVRETTVQSSEQKM